MRNELSRRKFIAASSSLLAATQLGLPAGSANDAKLALDGGPGQLR